MTGDDPSIAGSASATVPQWGVFLNGTPVLVPDSFGAIEQSKEFKLLDYPIEGGAFETYNKVELPYDSHIIMRKGGSITDRTSFLTALDSVIAALDLYDILMPEYQYHNANMSRYSFERTDQSGSTMLTITLWFREIRVTATQTFSQVQNPASAAPATDGQGHAIVPPNALPGYTAPGT